jgi:hypothetical protein
VYSATYPTHGGRLTHMVYRTTNASLRETPCMPLTRAELIGVGFGFGLVLDVGLRASNTRGPRLAKHPSADPTVRLAAEHAPRAVLEERVRALRGHGVGEIRPQAHACLRTRKGAGLTLLLAPTLVPHCTVVVAAPARPASATALATPPAAPLLLAGPAPAAISLPVRERPRPPSQAISLLSPAGPPPLCVTAASPTTHHHAVVISVPHQVPQPIPQTRPALASNSTRRSHISF